ncbi:DUF3153 domain-containing protein [Thermoflavimicrobium dichotomicum]|uniref:LPXTG-motif cell wall anchor domain-containing protein n=1 Tax=Thermoflavimicrobium dichotomicum TaxID=46223 RepID=A0A1I3SV47_9BACL|nr:DUF3153 domain-containing protein [Thermoflavimicrobium dichotomicum]SFJ62220.1 Protein of unknown function [Thermoflavimicrobium dichotomicum]
MLNKKKITLSVLLLLMVAVLLTGCVDVDAHVTLNADLTGTYEFTFLTSSLADKFLTGNKDNQIEKMKEQLAQQGYQIQEITKDDKTGWKATKNVDNFLKEPPTNLSNNLKTAYDWATKQVASLQGSQPMPPNENGTGSGFTTDWGLFFTTLKMDVHVDAKKFQQNSSFDEIPEQWKNMILDKINLRFILTLPVAATEHNATSVSEDGKTLTWKLNPTGDNHIYIAKDVPNPFTWGILLIAGIILLVVLLRKRKKKQTTMY